MKYDNLASLPIETEKNIKSDEDAIVAGDFCLLNPEIWPQWKQSNKIKLIAFEDESFKGLDLSDLDFANVQFIRCRFYNCKFHRTNLISSNLSDSKFIECDFLEAKLIAAVLERCVFDRCQLRKVNFLTAFFKKTVIVNTDLSDIDLQTIDLRGITLDGCDLRKQNLAGKDLSNASLRGVDLREANLENAILNHAELCGSLFAASIVKNTQFKRANLSHCNLSALDFSGANLKGANLRHSNLSSVKFNGANLSQANLTDSTLFNLSKIGWDISGIYCEFAYWDEKATAKTVYKAHEFERLYAESLTIDLKYDFRLTANEIATLPIMIEHLQACHWGVALRLKSVNDIAGGALVQLVVDKLGSYSVNELEASLKQEAFRIQNAQLIMRSDRNMRRELTEAVAAIKDKFWPRLLELATEYEVEQIRDFSVLFIDLKGFSQWSDVIVSERLSLFRGLLKPILAKWNASHPNMEGDSLRVTFRKASLAIECAWMIREVLMAADFELRIGIDLGEVTVVHNEVTDQVDLEGASVNMAARIESMAEPGQIFVSEKVKHCAEQQTDKFKFVQRKSQLKKSIGSKMAGEWLTVYEIDKITKG